MATIWFHPPQDYLTRHQLPFIFHANDDEYLYLPSLRYASQPEIGCKELLLPLDSPCHLTATEHRARICYHLSRPDVCRLSFISWLALEAYWNHQLLMLISLSTNKEQSEIQHG